MRLLYYFRKVVVTALFGFLAFTGTAQTVTSDTISPSTPRPYMYLSRDTGLTRLANFDSLKLASFVLSTQRPQPNLYHLDNFLGMISYFKDRYKDSFQTLDVYLAIYGENGPAGHPEQGELLTFIFVPKNGDTELGYYNLPDHVKFDTRYPSKFEVNDSEFVAWTNEYVKLMPLTSLSPTDPKNKYNGKLSDTRAVSYCAKDLFMLVKEQHYKHYSKNKPRRRMYFTKNFIIELGAYRSNRNSLANRTVLNFNWTDKSGKIIHLDDTQYFAERPKGLSACGESLFVGIDNGQLCPPNCH